MSANAETSEPVAPAARADEVSAGVDQDRREALRRLGYAAALAPAMVVLLKGQAQAMPSCDNPAWQLGLQRAGHSGC